MYQLLINRKNSKKGFTLVEVIVVLVILAILAAIMIPAMTGWIDKAKDKAVLVEARSALLACQTIVSEKYGAATKFEAGSLAVADINAAIALADLAAESIKSGAYNADGQITKLVYTGSNKKSTEYTWTATGGGSWTDPA